jgi:hypothetical protein
VCGNHSLRVEITLVRNEITLVRVEIALVLNDITLRVEITLYVYKLHSCVWYLHYACEHHTINHTRACKNHSRMCWNHSRECVLKIERVLWHVHLNVNPAWVCKTQAWLGLNPQIGRPLSRIVVPLVYFIYLSQVSLFLRERVFFWVLY